MGMDMDMNETQPKCYSDRQTWKKTDKYMFVSYAHKDADIVYSDLHVLYNNCLNYWYDKKLSVGDEWDREVEEIIRDEQCAGIILFFSPDMVKSKACEKELQIYKDIVINKKKQFKLIPISITGNSVNATVRDAYVSCSELSQAELDNVLPAERVKNIFENVSSSVLYLNRAENGFYLTKLIEILKDYDENLFCSDDVALDKLARLPIVSKENNVSFIRLGIYPQEKVEGDFAIQNGVKDYADGKLTIKNGVGYKHSAVRWIIIKNDNQKAMAIAEYVLDKCKGTEIQEYLRTFIDKSIEDTNIKDCIESVDLPQLADLSEYENIISDNEETEYCKSYPKNSLWAMYWGKQNDNIVAYYRKHSPITSNTAVNMMCGIRPYIIIDIDKLLEKYTR